jgi:DNA adenine methylase
VNRRPKQRAFSTTRNRTGYNGLCRFNSQGRFNVPFGRHEGINYINDFFAYRILFEDWQFSATDFARIRLEADDFIYADPPYDVEFTQYSEESFTWDDQVRLAEWLMRHSRASGSVQPVDQPDRVAL